MGDTVHEADVFALLASFNVRETVALGPTGDALHEAGLGSRDFFEFVLEFLPDARHSEEHSGTGPL